MNVGIVGGGVFGLAAALELNARGHAVTVVGPSSVAGCPDWLRVSFSVPVPVSTTTRQTATS